MTRSMFQQIPGAVHLSDGNSDAGRITVTACTYNLPVDRGYGWRLGLRPGCFDRQTKGEAHRVKVLWQHDRNEPIGRALSLTNSPDGTTLQAEAMISTNLDVPTALKARALLLEGILDQVSVGFNIKTYDVEKDPENKTETWWVTRGHLQEFSIVTFGAQGDAAKVRSVQDDTDTPRPDHNATHYRRLLDSLRVVRGVPPVPPVGPHPA